MQKKVIFGTAINTELDEREGQWHHAHNIHNILKPSEAFALIPVSLTQVFFIERVSLGFSSDRALFRLNYHLPHF